MWKLARILFRINVVLAIIAIALILFAHFAMAEPVIKNKTYGEIKIMVIDTGVEPVESLKPYLQTEAKEHYRDRHGHGTHVAGIIMFGDLNVNKEYVPSCDAVKLYSCKYLDSRGLLDDEMGDPHKDSSTMATRCIRMAILKGVDVINYSSGGPDYNAEEEAAIELAGKYGITVLAAAGNGNEVVGNDLDGKTKYYPASLATRLDNVIPIGNMDRRGVRVGSSNYGMFGKMQWDIGDEVRSTAPNGGTKIMSGTSQATPMYLYHFLKRNCDKIKQEKK